MRQTSQCLDSAPITHKNCVPESIREFPCNLVRSLVDSRGRAMFGHSRPAFVLLGAARVSMGIIFSSPRRLPHVRGRSVGSSAGFTRRRLRVTPNFTCTHDESVGLLFHRMYRLESRDCVSSPWGRRELLISDEDFPISSGDSVRTRATWTDLFRNQVQIPFYLVPLIGHCLYSPFTLAVITKSTKKAQSRDSQYLRGIFWKLSHPEASANKPWYGFVVWVTPSPSGNMGKKNSTSFYISLTLNIPTSRSQWKLNKITNYPLPEYPGCKKTR